MKNKYEIVDDGKVCRIYFNDGTYFLIDSSDFDFVSERNWFKGKRGYPISHGRINSSKKYKTETLHQFLLNPESGYDVDHISGDKFDNRRTNLRICTHQQNMFNQKIRNTNTTGYTGVSYSKNAKKYEAYINQSGKKIHLGFFNSAEEAAIARNTAAIKLYGEYARLNIIKTN